jgi:protocatechuate 3,4-dioxygenase beta subunit
MGVKSAVELSHRLARKLFRSPSAKSRSRRLDVTSLEDRLQPAGTVSGQVFLDFNANGAFDAASTIPNRSLGNVGLAGDTGFKGVTVSAYDSNNAKVGSGTTDGTGTYSFSMTGVGPYRIEFTGLPAGVLYGPTGTTARSNVQYVPEGGSSGVNLAVSRTESTAEYAISAGGPQLVTQVYQFGSATGVNASAKALWDWRYNAGTEDDDTTRDNYRVPDTNTLGITHSQIGSTWGLSYDTVQDRIFAAAFTKRFSGFGPNGPGAIYAINGVTGTTSVSLLADLNALFPADLPAGANYRGTSPNDSFFIQGDGLTNNVGWNAVGKTGLGGMDLSDDGSRIFVMALGDRRLYSIPTSGPINTSTVQRFNLPVPASVTGISSGNPLGDLRPFAVEFYRGKVYVGATNTAESTQNRNDLKAYVFRFDPATGQFENLAGAATTTEAVHTVDLNYQRGIAHPGDNGIDDNGMGDDVSANWLPWANTYSNLTSIPANADNQQGFRGIYPQAWLTSLSFENNGNLTLAFRDRAGDQFGRFTPSNPANPNELTFGIIAGDIIKAFGQPGAGWTTENNGSGGSGVANGQGPGGGEFYGQDNLPQSNTQPRVDPSDHDEVAMGAALNLAGFPDTVYTAFDPERIALAYNSGGVRWASNNTGNNVKGYQIYRTEDQFSNVSPPPTFAKANGLGDLIAIAKAPVSLGNFVWFDANSNGVQDPNENPLAGITMELWGAGKDDAFGTSDDVAVAVATTDASGNYVFSSANGTNTASSVYNLPIIPGTNYQIRVPLGQAPLANRKIATAFADTGADKTLRDSNGVAGTGSLATFAVIDVTAPQSGGNDHTLDIGFTRGPTYKIGDFVWEDANNDGVFQTGENPMKGIDLQLLDIAGKVIQTRTTGTAGDYLFDDLDPGKYSVRVVASSLPSGYISSTGKVGFATGPYEPATGGSNGNNTDHGTSDGAGFVVASQVQLINADILTQDFGFFRPLAIGDFVWFDSDNSGTYSSIDTPLDNIAVDLLDKNGGLIDSRTTAGGGKYRFSFLVPGDYQVRVATPAGYVSSTGKNGSATGPFEPGTSKNVDNQDHGTQSGGFAVGPVITLFAPGNAGNPEESGTANLNQDFGLIQPLSLGDTVWLDDNNNGLLDSGESGISKVTVNLRDDKGNLLGTTTTNDKGGYLFSYLLPGSYRVEVVNSTLPAGLISSTGTNASATGKYEPSAGNFGDGQDAGTTAGTITQGALVTLAIGTAPTGEAPVPGGIADPASDPNSNRIQDFGFFRPLAIGDFVWDDKNNDGKLTPGEVGLDGVTVELLDGNSKFIAKTTTAGGGNYLFDNIVAATYQIRVTPPAGYTSSTGKQNSPTGPFEPGVTGLEDNQDHGSNDKSFVTAIHVNLTNAANLPDLGGRANLRQDFGLFQAYSIGDQVWLDANNNGLFDNGETGIQDVVVELLDGFGALIGGTKTDATGNYLFGALSAGKYQVRVTTPSGMISSTGKAASLTGPFEPGVTGLQNNEDHGTMSGLFTLGGFVNLGVPAEMPDSGGTANLRQDFGFFQPLSLGDTVWVDVNNDGKFGPGELGQGGVVVDLLDGKSNVLATTTTDSKGQYLFSFLTGTTYQVRITPPVGFISSSGTNASLTGPYEPAPAGVLNLDNEDHGTNAGSVILGPQIDLGLPANRPDGGGTANLRQDFGIYQPLSLGDFVWEDTNNNGKFDTGEAGLAGLAVELLDGKGAILATTKTATNGTYGFGSLIPGDYRVRLTPPAGGKYVSSSGTNGSLSGPYEPGVSGNQNNEDHGTTAGSFIQTSLVTLGLPGSATNPDNNGLANLRQDFGLFQPLALGNFVFYDKNNDGKFGGSDTPLADVPVQLFDSTGAVIGKSVTDSKGNYLFSNLVPGSYDVAITGINKLVSSSGTPGSNLGPYEPASVTGPDNEDHGTTAGSLIRANGVVLGAPGSTLNPNDEGYANLTIDFGLMDQPANAKISGFVYVDPNINGIRETGERPIPGTKVTLIGTDLLGNTINQVTFTDSKGFYEFAQLPPGKYSVIETQPTGILFDGLDTPGTSGGTVPVSDTIANIVLNGNDNSQNNNFGEIPPAQVFGFVYEDLNRNNRFDPGEPPISNTTIRVDGTAFAGSVLTRPLTASDSKNGVVVTTDINGRWEFFGLPPGNYNIRETQPDGYDTLFNSNEDSQSFPVTVGAQFNDVFSGAVVPSGITRGAFNFGEIRSDRRDPTKREFLGSTDPNSPGAGGGVNQPVSTTPNFPPPGSGTSQDPTFVINAAGPGRSPLIRVFDYTAGIQRNQFLAYESSFTGGVRVAKGDINGDGIDDIITATGIGGGPRIRVFSGVDNSIVLRDFFAYESTFRGGVFVASGDIDGDGRADIITGTESGGGPRVRVFSGQTGNAVLRDFFAFDPNQRGGVRVAAGDVTGDGRADIIAATGTGQGVPTRVRTFDGNTGNQVIEFAPFGAGFTGGANIAVGRFSGTVDSIVVSADSGGGPVVGIYNGTTGVSQGAAFAYDSTGRFGVRVATADINGDGISDIITSPSGGVPSHIKVLNGTNLNSTLDAWFAFDTTFLGGTFVA